MTAHKIKTQAALNKALKAGKTEFEFVAAGDFEINFDKAQISVAVSAALRFDVSIKALGSSSVVARESSSVVAWGSSSVEARESSSVEARESSSVVAWGSSRVEARESSRVVARESSSVVAWGSSSVVAWGSSSVEARESSSVVARESSRVEARESSRVVAWGSSSVEAWGSSRVEARESSSVEAWGSSSVVARESSRVVARESSSVVAWGSSRVVARESSRVEAWGSSSVVAWGSSSVVASGFVSLYLWGKVKAKISAKCHAYLRHKQASAEGGMVTEAIVSTPQEWCDYHGVKVTDGIAIVYKGVRECYGSNRDPQFKYLPGTTPQAPAWNDRECSDGLHFSPCPSMTLEFISDAKRFLACPVKVSDMLIHFEGSYPHKCKVPGVAAPIWEVDIHGNKIEQEKAA
jgi:hypothetical protein